VGADAVWFALARLSKADLLQQPIVLPHAKAGMSRRSAIRRLGIGALMVPAVISIVAPTAMAGASIPTVCQTCVKKVMGPGDCGVCDTSFCGACHTDGGCGSSSPSCTTCTACFTLSGPRSWVAPAGCTTC
jgi:hypothetical protein